RGRCRLLLAALALALATLAAPGIARAQVPFRVQLLQELWPHTSLGLDVYLMVMTSGCGASHVGVTCPVVAHLTPDFPDLPPEDALRNKCNAIVAAITTQCGGSPLTTRFVVGDVNCEPGVAQQTHFTVTDTACVGTDPCGTATDTGVSIAIGNSPGMLST